MSVRELLIECSKRYSVPTRLHGENSFRFACDIEFVDEEASHADSDALEVAAAPEQVRELWATCSKAKLFIDVDYGQWGLILLGPAETRARTLAKIDVSHANMRPGDLVIGEFLGDLDLLISAADGSILVSLPLDSREDWYHVGKDLETFLAEYVSSEGRKFWVPGAR